MADEKKVEKKLFENFNPLEPLDDLAGLLGFAEKKVEEIATPKIEAKKDESETKRSRRENGDVNVTVNLGDKLKEFFRSDAPAEKTGKTAGNKEQSPVSSGGDDGGKAA